MDPPVPPNANTYTTDIPLTYSESSRSTPAPNPQQSVPVNVSSTRLTTNHPASAIVGDLNQRTLRSQGSINAVVETVFIPRNISEALASPQAESWIAAMQVELDSMESHDVYEIVDLPPDRKAAGSR